MTPTVAAIVMLGLLTTLFHLLFAFDALSFRTIPREEREQ